MEQFLERYSNYIVPARCQIDVITAANLQNSFEKMNRNRTVTPSGWRMCELRALGQEVVTMLAELLDDIERGGEWPEFMLELTTSKIPRETEPDNTNFSEKEVMAGSAMAMRQINNASPIYSARSLARWRAVTEWREQWLPQSMAGGRPNKEASDVTLERPRDGLGGHAKSLCWRDGVGLGKILRLTTETFETHCQKN